MRILHVVQTYLPAVRYGGLSLRFMTSVGLWRRGDTKFMSSPRTLTDRESVPCQSKFRRVWTAFSFNSAVK
jgi:hypothetical protein